MKKYLAILFMCLFLVGCGSKYNEEDLNKAARKHEAVMSEIKRLNQKLSRYMSELQRRPSMSRIQQISRDTKYLQRDLKSQTDKSKALDKSTIPVAEVIRWVFENDKKEFPTLHAVGKALYDKADNKDKKTIKVSKKKKKKKKTNECISVNLEYADRVVTKDSPGAFNVNYKSPFDGYGMVFVALDKQVGRVHPQKSSDAVAVVKDQENKLNFPVKGPVPYMANIEFIFVVSTEPFVDADISKELYNGVVDGNIVLPKGFKYYTANSE